MLVRGVPVALNELFKGGVYNISHSPVLPEIINFYRVSFLFWAKEAHSILVMQYEWNL